MNLLFMGRKAAGAHALEWSIGAGFDVVGVVTDEDNPASVTAETAHANGVPIYGYEEVIEAIDRGELYVDVAVSYVFWKIIGEPLLSAPRFGIINFHPAPLPEYRGTAGYNVAILEELDQWAVTAHYMDENIDTGGIIDRFAFSIDPVQETAKSLEKKSHEFMVSLYKKTMRRVFEQGVLNTTPNEGGRYISRKQMEEMKKIEPGDDIDKKIRAFWFPPYRGAYIEINDKKYTLVSEDILRRLADTNAKVRFGSSQSARPDKQFSEADFTDSDPEPTTTSEE